MSQSRPTITLVEASVTAVSVHGIAARGAATAPGAPVAGRAIVRLIEKHSLEYGLAVAGCAGMYRTRGLVEQREAASMSLGASRRAPAAARDASAHRAGRGARRGVSPGGALPRS